MKIYDHFSTEITIIILISAWAMNYVITISATVRGEAWKFGALYVSNPTSYRDKNKKYPRYKKILLGFFTIVL